eukprot:Sspe_Gene.11740::Locus_3977_Transcript_1_1_Confidence_1.000_Length_3222::g.11740::m.11740
MYRTVHELTIRNVLREGARRGWDRPPIPTEGMSALVTPEFLYTVPDGKAAEAREVLSESELKLDVEEETDSVLRVRCAEDVSSEAERLLGDSLGKVTVSRGALYVPFLGKPTEKALYIPYPMVKLGADPFVPPRRPIYIPLPRQS